MNSWQGNSHPVEGRYPYVFFSPEELEGIIIPKTPNAFSWLWGVKTRDWEKLEESSFLWDLALPPPHCVTLGRFLTFLNLSCLISIVGIMILSASCVCSGHHKKWRSQVFLDHGKCSVNISSVILSLASITRKDPIPYLLRGSYSFWKGIALA